jgi:hypothetical protein
MALNIGTLYAQLSLNDKEFVGKVQFSKVQLDNMRAVIGKIGTTPINTNNLRALSAEIKSLEAASAELRAKLLNVVPGSARAEEYENELAAIEHRLKGLQQVAEDTRARLSRIGDAMRNVGTKLTLGVTLPIVGLGAAITKMAMEAVEDENLFEESMEGMTESARKWSEELRNQLGLNAYEVRKNVGVFNVMLGSMGLGTEKAYDMAKGLTLLAYDMSSFYNIAPDEMFEKLQSGITGMTMPLRRLGIVILDEQVKQKAYQMGIAETGAELTEAQKVMSRYQLIMEATSKAQGDLARTIDSPINKLRVLQSELQEIGIKFGTLLLPAFQAVIDIIKKAVDALGEMNPGMRKAIIGFAALAALIGPFLVAMAPIVTAIANLAIANTLLAGGIGAAAGGLAAAAGPIGMVIAACVLLAAAIYGVYKATHKNLQADVDAAKGKQDLADKSKKLMEEYEELKKKVKPTADELARMRDIMTELKLISPDLVKNGKPVEDWLDKIAKKAKAATDELRKAMIVSAEDDVKKAESAFKRQEKWLTKFTDAQKRGPDFTGEYGVGSRTRWSKYEHYNETGLAKRIIEESNKLDKLAVDLNAARKKLTAIKSGRNPDEQATPYVHGKGADYSANADEAAAEKIRREAALRHATEIHKLEMERNQKLNEAKNKGPKERAAIWADYEDQIATKYEDMRFEIRKRHLSEIKQLELEMQRKLSEAKRSGSSAKELALIREDYEDQINTAKKAQAETERNAHGEYLAAKLRMSRMTYAAERQEAENTYKSEMVPIIIILASSLTSPLSLCANSTHSRLRNTLSCSLVLSGDCSLDSASLISSLKQGLVLDNPSGRWNLWS